MTFKAPDKLPYDAWFDENPLKDSKYIDTPSYASRDMSVHQQMYDCLLYTSPSPRDR